VTEEKMREQEVISAENERCRLANECEWEALDFFLADEMTFVHSVGRIENKSEWVAGLKALRRYFFRDSLNVRMFGDVAVTTGGLTHVFLDDAGVPSRVLPVAVLQVWVNRDGDWKLFANQHTRTPIAR
jgi:hypothetical protein